VNSSNITNFAPYIAYVSSVSIPGRIATVRDAVGLVSSPGRLIIVSTLKGVLFSDRTSSITISQPYGYISLSSRDKNTWDIINTFAFPQPSPVSYVSSVYATASINANSIVARSNISTPYINVNTISTLNINTANINVSSIAVYDAFNNKYLNPINASNGNLCINNQLNVSPYFTITSGLINTGNLDNNNYNISNVTNLSNVYNIYGNNIYAAGIGSLDPVVPIIPISANITMGSFTISPLQTAATYNAATNDIISKYLLITNSNTQNIGITGTFNKIAESALQFTLNTVFSKYKFRFYFKGQASSSVNNTFFYCMLSNTTTGLLYGSSNIGSNISGGSPYPIQVRASSYINTITQFQYTDIFNTNGVADSLSVLLYGLTDGTIFLYSNVNFYMTYEPVL
jgi:hypothetical protein